MNASQLASTVARHCVVGVGDEAFEVICKCGWNDLASLHGYHLIEVMLDLEDAIIEGQVPSAGARPQSEPVLRDSPAPDAPSPVIRASEASARPRDIPAAIIAAVRVSSTYLEAAKRLDWDGGGLSQHLDLMEHRGELPEDVIAWRRARTEAGKSRSERRFS